MCYKSALRLSNNSDMNIEGKALLLFLLLLLLAFKSFYRVPCCPKGWDEWGAGWSASQGGKGQECAASVHS